MRHFTGRWIARFGLVVVLIPPAPASAGAQDHTPVQTLASADRRPRFWKAERGATPPSAVDPQQVSVLRRRITVDFDGVPLKTALAEISRQAQLPFMYSLENLPLDARVRFRAEHITVAGALSEVLVDTDLDVLLSADDRIGLVKRGTMTQVHGAIGALVGQVTDSATGRALAGADVFLENTRWRTTTDGAGRFALTAIDAGTYTMVVRSLGYAKRTRSVTLTTEGTDTINVVLAPVATRLNELVSTATGIRRRMDIPNDVTTINADSVVRNQPITSVTDLLETRVPGLTVQRTSGAPGDPARLRLRGAGSPLHNNDPIVIVDGIRMYAEQSAGRSANLATVTHPGDTTSYFSNYAAPSPLDYIDPNTIETIEVIKGPSAATLYGPDAANGVIVITTKKGKAGPTRWTFTGDHGGSRVPGGFPDLTVRWGHLANVNNTPLQCGRSNSLNTSLGTGIACETDSVVTYQLLNDPALTVLDHGNRNAFTLGASGGVQALTYAVTGSYQREVGLFKLPGYEVDRYEGLHGDQIPPDWMQRPQQLTQWGVSSRLGAQLGRTAEVSLSAQFTHTDQQRSSLERQLGNLLTTYFDQASGSYYIPNGSGIVSTTAALLSNYYQRVTAGATQFTNGLNLTWHPRPWLTVTGDAGLNIDHRDDELFLPRGAFLPTEIGDTTGALNNGHGSSLLSTVDLRSTATVPFGLGFRFNFSTGVNYRGQSISDLTLATHDVPEGTSSLGSILQSGVRRLQNDATFGWYVEPSLTHRKFTLTTGLRLDGGSNYGSRVSTTGGLPKLGFSYLLSEEPFFPFKDLFQSFRVRAAYGRASRQPGIAEQLRLYTTTVAHWVDGGIADAVALSGLGNTELKPERTTEFEGGFDADLLDGRIGVTFSLYRKTTDDALLSVPLAPSIYGDGISVPKNIGVIRNTGLEATARTQLVRSDVITWSVDLGVSRNRSLVVKLAPGVQPFYTQASGYINQRVAPGYPLYGRWALPILGYADVNGDGVLQTSEVAVGDTAVYIGSAVPNYLLDLHSDFSFWRGTVTVSAGLHYDDGLTQLDEVSQGLSPFSAALNSPTSTLGEQAAAINLFPTTNYNWYQAVNVFRFQSLAVAYRMPPTVAQRVGAQTLSVQLQGTNLGLWTNYRGLDPNVNAFGTGNAVSDNGVLPQPRTWQVRINATY